MLLSIILQAAAGAAIGKAASVIGAGIVAIAAAFGISKIGKSALDGIARQPEAAGDIRTSMIIIAALVEGVCLFGVIVCLLALFI